MKTWIVIDQHNHAFQLRCSTFAFCYVRIALLCSHYAEAKFLRSEFFEIVFGYHTRGKAFTREPNHCPFQGSNKCLHLLRYAFTIWTQLVIYSRERQVLRSPITRRLTQIMPAHIAAIGIDLVGSSVLPTHFEPMGV